MHRTYLGLLVNKASTYSCSLLIMLWMRWHNPFKFLVLLWTQPNPTQPNPCTRGPWTLSTLHTPLLHHWRTVYKWRYRNKNVVRTNIYGLNCFWLERLMLNLSTCTRTFSNTNIQFGKYWRYTVKLRYDGLGYNGYSVIADYFLVPG